MKPELLKEPARICRRVIGKSFANPNRVIRISVNSETEIYAAGDTMRFRCNLPAEGMEKGTYTVPAEHLAQILSVAGGEDITLKQENGKIILNVKGTTYTLNTQKPLEREKKGEDPLIPILLLFAGKASPYRRG